MRTEPTAEGQVMILTFNEYEVAQPSRVGFLQRDVQFCCVQNTGPNSHLAVSLSAF